MKNKIINVLKVVFCIYWCICLKNTEAYYFPYIIVGMLGLIGIYYNIQQKNSYILSKKVKVINMIFITLFTLLITLGNYKELLLENVRDELFWLKISCFIFSSIVVFREIFLMTMNWFKNLKEDQRETFKTGNLKIFFIAWIIYILVYISVMILAQYPGNLTSDNIDQITQGLVHHYSNHHPYYHTQIIHFILWVGMKIFGDINIGIAAYSICSILIMSFCFAYAVYTVWEMGKDSIISTGMFLVYLIMPYHIVYSFTMWKDVFFAASMTLFSVVVFRRLKKVRDLVKIDNVIMICSGLGICLLRSNGFFVFIFSIIIFVVLFGKEQKKMIITFVMIAIIAFIFKHPVLKMLHVTQPDMIESLSIPAQQISRVITDGGKLTKEERETLNQVVDIDLIHDTYDSGIADPIKNLVRNKNNQKFVIHNKMKFIKLYIDIGFRYPHKYVEAWIDQTKGYWNSGYAYWRWSTNIEKNNLGIHRVVKISIIYKALEKYLNIWENSTILQTFLSIGFMVWILLIIFYIALINKNRYYICLVIPFLILIITLLIATPVYSEFRYVYSVFCAIPLILGIVFSERLQNGKCTCDHIVPRDLKKSEVGD